MKAGQNSNAIREHDVEQRVRKAWDERAPGLAIGDSTGEWMLSDEAHDKVE